MTVRMALPRVCLFRRSVLSKGSPARIATSILRSTRIAVASPHRHFTLRSCLFEELVQHPVAGSPSAIPLEEIPEEQQRKNARSVVVTNMPKKSNRTAVEALFQENGLEMCV
jgi:hypothetical protein